MNRIFKAVVLTLAVCSVPGWADDIVFEKEMEEHPIFLSGTFNYDNDVALIRFVVKEDPFKVSIYSSSWEAGGFNPFLTIFNSSGEWVDAAGYEEGDFLYIDDGEYLEAGATYIAAITQFPNFALGTLSEGFTFDNEENFTVTEQISELPFGGSEGSPRSGYWAVNFKGVSSAELINGVSVPEPRVYALILTGLGCLLISIIRRKG